MHCVVQLPLRCPQKQNGCATSNAAVGSSVGRKRAAATHGVAQPHLGSAYELLRCCAALGAAAAAPSALCGSARRERAAANQLAAQLQLRESPWPLTVLIGVSR